MLAHRLRRWHNIDILGLRIVFASVMLRICLHSFPGVNDLIVHQGTIQRKQTAVTAHLVEEIM